MAPLSKKRVVAIGGGTGNFTVLRGIKNHFENVTAVVSMSDEGGSTGLLREEFGILPPGDVRRALIALAATDPSTLSELFSYRFDRGSSLSGHVFGNLMIAALERITGNFEKAVEEVGKILRIQGRVLPVTLKPTYLVTWLDDGRVIRGEMALHAQKPEEWTAVKKIWLEPPVPINPKATKAILQADCVIISPGDLYSDTIPNLIVEGMREVLKKTKATVVYFVNITTSHGESTGFSAADFVATIESYLGKGIINYVVVNKTRPSLARLKPYLDENAGFVEPDVDRLGSKPTPIITDLVRANGLVRHDPEKIAKVVKMLV
ncbi:MAG: gluconeogenesis factor YvcK family protein [Patescibacteria group bacterium]